MLAHPDLGFVDSGVDFLQPELYAACRTRFGIASALPRRTYTSPVFQQLENEKVWTRDWICIGTAPEIANPHDLLPYTIGQHAIHVQRTASGGLIGRFNKAQHGGCRAIPAQCQTGRKTKCSYTSCGFSRDRDVIAGELFGEMTPQAGQYLGVYPERLLPVSVETRGPLIFANITRPSAEPALRPRLNQRLRPTWCGWRGSGVNAAPTGRSPGPRWSMRRGPVPTAAAPAIMSRRNGIFPISSSSNPAAVRSPSCCSRLRSISRCGAFRLSAAHPPQIRPMTTCSLRSTTQQPLPPKLMTRSNGRRPATSPKRRGRPGASTCSYLDRVSAVHPSYWNAPLTRARAGL